jgi:tRNA(fMet)-specific endonuclease VapC
MSFLLDTNICSAHLKRPEGITVNTADLMIASVALVHDLTLVTHNTADFRLIPDLRLDDWLT